MCSPMLTVQAAPTNASFVRGTCCDIPPVYEKYETEFSPLHMNWVMVDDTKGHFQAQMQWVVNR
jgi:hypothetical protein